MRSSRLTRLERKRAVRSVFLLFVTVVVLIGLLFYWGVSFVIKLAAFVSDFRSTSEITQSQNDIHLPAPNLDALPEATPSAKVSVSGFSLPGSLVVIWVNGNELPAIITMSDGSFEAQVPLSEGENTIQAKATNDRQSFSQPSATQVIVRDSSAPILEITSPQPNQKRVGSGEKVVPIDGKTEVEAGVTVNGRFVLLTNDGRFTHSLELAEGENRLTIIATDRAGNQAIKDVLVYWQP